MCRCCASTNIRRHVACFATVYTDKDPGKRETGMDRDQLIQRLRARVRRGGPAEQVWWNGELLHVSQAIARAAQLGEQEPIRARGDDVVILRTLRDTY